MKPTFSDLLLFRGKIFESSCIKCFHMTVSKNLNYKRICISSHYLLKIGLGVIHLVRTQNFLKKKNIS